LAGRSSELKTVEKGNDSLFENGMDITEEYPV